jgi:Type II secretion system protein B
MIQKQRREQARQAALKAVQELALQSIMFSENRRACMINNSLYREGQQVDDFTVDKISPQSVIVKTGPYRFELRMQH